jgi:hypothetical protein
LLLAAQKYAPTSKAAGAMLGKTRDKERAHIIFRQWQNHHSTMMSQRLSSCAAWEGYLSHHFSMHVFLHTDFLLSQFFLATKRTAPAARLQGRLGISA